MYTRRARIDKCTISTMGIKIDEISLACSDRHEREDTLFCMIDHQ